MNWRRFCECPVPAARILCSLQILLLWACITTAAPNDQQSKRERFSTSEQADGVTVSLDGEVFTRYLKQSGGRPVLWPVVGPTGHPVTRAYPMGEGPEQEVRDHVHHRSIWIGYEGINGLDFWHEEGQRAFPRGRQVHREFSQVEAEGNGATIIARTDWVGENDEKIAEDYRTLRFGVDGDQRWIDYRWKLTASEGPLEIGDSKEGVFAVRVAESIRVDAKDGGAIVSSRGLRNGDAWSQPAEWVDYHGPVGGETVGIAILAHPESYNSPPPWHVRTYGLFAANPFGKLAFQDGAPEVKERPLRLIIDEGDSITLRYRIILHRGDEQDAGIAEKYERYTRE